MSHVDLVIFDCDGVLVDSERLAVRTEADILSRLGWPLDEAEIIERFVGRSAAYMQHEVETAIGRSIDWEADFEVHYRDAFERELTAIEGVAETLSTLQRPFCVASSGTHRKIRHSLSLVQLSEYFDGRIFSTDDVTRGKPAPDLFLYAAAAMNVAPESCVVIEDSVPGVLAGRAAGMHVFGFDAGVTSRDKLANAGAQVFSHMSSVPHLIAGFESE